jgi:transcriptional/translational regulatory protein YebC/TACO1
LSLGEVEEIAIEVDCEEVNELKDDQEELGRCFELRFDLQNIAKLEEELKSKGFVVENIEQRLVPQYKITLPEDENAAVQKLYSLFQEYEDIKNIFDNLE